MTNIRKLSFLYKQYATADFSWSPAGLNLSLVIVSSQMIHELCECITHRLGDVVRPGLGDGLLQNTKEHSIFIY